MTTARGARHEPLRTRPELGAALLFVLLAILTLAPLLRTGFTDHDSMDTAIHLWSEEPYFDWVGALARGQGRWQIYVTSALQALPFLVARFWFYKAVSLASMLFGFIAFVWAVREVLGSARFALLLGLVFLTALQVTADHSLLTGYFVTYHLFIGALSLSLLFFHRYLETHRRGNLVASAALVLVCCLLREFTVLYFALFVVMAVGIQGRRGLFALSPHAFFLVAFLAAYAAFRSRFSSGYAGNTVRLDGFSPWLAVKTNWLFSVTSFPLTVLFDDRYAAMFEFYRAPTAVRGPAFLLPVLEARWMWILRAGMSAALAVALLARDAAVFTRRIWIAGFGVSLFLLFAPNSLIALTRGYQQIVRENGAISMHMTYFSWFGAALFIALSLAALFRFVARFRPGVRRACLACAAALAAYVSLAVDYSNHYVTLSQGLLAERWLAMDRFLETEPFTRIPEDALIFAPSLTDPVYSAYYAIHNFSGAHLVRRPGDTDPYWTKYAKMRAGKRVRFTDDRAEITRAVADSESGARPAVWYLRFVQGNTMGNASFVLAKIARSEADGFRLIGTSVTVLSQRPVEALKRRDRFLPLVGALGNTDIVRESGEFDLDRDVLPDRAGRRRALVAGALPIIPLGEIFEAENTYLEFGLESNGPPGISGTAISGGPLHIKVQSRRPALYELRLLASRGERNVASLFARVDGRRLGPWRFQTPTHKWDWQSSSFTFRIAEGDRLVSLEQQPQYEFPIDRIQIAPVEVDPALAALGGLSSARLENSRLEIRGWMLAPIPAERIEVFDGDRSLGAATLGLARPDILAKRPEYRDPQSGFSFTEEGTGVSPGARVAVKAFVVGEVVWEASRIIDE